MKAEQGCSNHRHDAKEYLRKRGDTYMRVSCACPADMATDTLVDRLRVLGIQPIITSQVIRAVYEGSDKRIGEAIVEMYAHECDHEINVQYDKEEQRKIERKIERKYQRAKRNAELHGHKL